MADPIVGTHYNVLRGPTGWIIATLPTTSHPDLLGWAFILPFWILALLLLFVLGSGIFALQRHCFAQIGSLYQTSSQFGLVWTLGMGLFTFWGFAGMGWQGMLLTFSGLGFWSCLLGFLLLRQTGIRLKDQQEKATNTQKRREVFN